MPFCSFECITFAAGSILAVFENHFDTVLAHKKLPSGSACTLSVSGPAECAKRFEFAVPRRGAGVLNPVRTPYRSPGELASPYLSAGLCGDRRSIPGPGCWPLFSVFFRFFRCSKKRSKNGRSKNRLFSEILAILVPPTSIFSNFWSQNRSADATFSVFF